MKARLKIFAILCVSFLSSFGFSLVILSMVLLVERYGGNALVYGIISAIYPMFQLVGAPTLGRLSDRYGRRPVLLISQIGACFAWIVYLISLYTPVITYHTVQSDIFGTFVITLPLIILFLSRAIEGFMAGNLSVAQAYIADITEEGARGVNYGKLAIASGLGFIIGPATAGLLSSLPYGDKLPVIAAVILSMLSIIFILFNLPETVKKHHYQPARERHLSEIIKNTDIRFMMLLYFLIYFAFNIFYTAFPVYALGMLKWDITKLGLYFSVLSLMTAFVQGPVLSRLSSKYLDATLCIVGSFILTFNFLFLTQTHDIWIYTATLFFAVGNGLMWPSILSLISKIAAEKSQGSVQGLNGASGSLASAIGLIMGGWLFDKIFELTFFIPALFIIIVFFLSFKLLNIERRSLTKV